MLLDGQSIRVLLEPAGDGQFRVSVDGVSHDVVVQDQHDVLLERFGGQTRREQGVQQVRAPMPGLVRAVRVSEGDSVEAGGGLLVLEAMKMENEVVAESAGVVRAVNVKAGDAVEKNQLMLELGPPEA